LQTLEIFQPTLSLARACWVCVCFPVVLTMANRRDDSAQRDDSRGSGRGPEGGGPRWESASEPSERSETARQWSGGSNFRNFNDEGRLRQDNDRQGRYHPPSHSRQPPYHQHNDQRGRASEHVSNSAPSERQSMSTSSSVSHGGAAETVGGSPHGMVHMDRDAGRGRGGFVARQDVRVGGGRHDDRHARSPITDHDRDRRQRESGGPITPLRDDKARAAGGVRPHTTAQHNVDGSGRGRGRGRQPQPGAARGGRAAASSSRSAHQSHRRPPPPPPPHLVAARASVRKTVPPELDFCADTFDPVAALAAVHVTLPCPSVLPLNNIAKFYTTVRRRPPPPHTHSPTPSLLSMNRNVCGGCFWTVGAVGFYP
jgi:hypothetical protein